jgi:PKD repeat protein
MTDPQPGITPDAPTVSALTAAGPMRTKTPFERVVPTDPVIATRLRGSQADPRRLRTVQASHPRTPGPRSLPGRVLSGRTRVQTLLWVALSSLALIAGLTGLGVATPSRAAADGALSVQVSGHFTDASGAATRPDTTGVVVGTVTADRLAFVPAANNDVVTGGESFAYTAVCANANGTSCSSDISIVWDFGDGTTTSALPAASGGLSQVHAYHRAGSYTVTATVTGSATTGTAPTGTGAYGTGSIRTLVSPRYADVDPAYTETTAAGSAVSANPVLAQSTAIWAVSALGLMGSCADTYSPATSTTVATAQATESGQALFCGAPGLDPVSTNAGSAYTSAPTNPIPRLDQFASTTAPYVNTANCFAAAVNCGLPAKVFADAGTPLGSPLASCTNTLCLQELANQNVITTANASTAQIVYNPTNCAGNTTAVLDATGSGSTTLARGVEPGCETRGDFLQALVTAVDGSDAATLASTPSGLAEHSYAATCTNGTLKPDAAGRDGIARAVALFAQKGVTFNPCDVDGSLTKGEAYRILYSVLRPAGGSSTVTFADLEDQTLGYGATAEPYGGTTTETGGVLDWKDQIYAVLAAGAPLVGSSTCVDTPLNLPADSCFNPDAPMTRAQTAQLLSFFILGDSSAADAVQVSLTADNNGSYHIGDTAALRLTVTAPQWLLPYTVQYAWSLGGGVGAQTATYGCKPTGTATLSSGSYTTTCPLTVHGQPAGGVIQAQVVVNGASYVVPLSVSNSPPTVTYVTVPPLTEDQGAATGTVVWTDPDNTPIGAVQVSASQTGPWSDLLQDASGTGQPVVNVQVTVTTDATNTATLTYTPQPDANGPFTFWVQACDSGNACSAAVQETGSITAVNDAPIADPVASVLRQNNVSTPSGDCRTQQGAAAPSNGFTLHGEDPHDVGWPGYPVAIITSYAVTAPATAFGTMWVCSSSGTWTAVTAGQTAPSTYATVVWNPTVGVYGSATFAYTVTDGGYPTGGLMSAPQPITVSNTSPGVPPIAALDTTISSGAALSDAFGFSGARSAENGSNAAIASYSLSYGDGTATSAQTSSQFTHRYSAAGVYTVTLTVTDQQGLTGTTSTTVSVFANQVGNPTFETGSQEWVAPAGSDAVLGIDSLTPHGGANDLAVTQTGSGTCSVAHTPPALVNSLVAGSVYSGKEWVLPSAASAGKSATMTLAETNSAGSIVGAQTATVVLGSAGTWQQVAVTATAVTTGDSLTLTTGLTGYSGASCFNLDDVSLTVAATPVVTSVSPSSGPGAGGTAITVTGTNLTNVTAAAVGSVSASVSCPSSTTCTVLSPAQADGAQQVTVTNAAGRSATGSGSTFTYVG